MSKDSLIMVVAGGEWQIPIVQKVKEMGYKVLNTNLYHDSPAFEYADVSCVADVLDLKANLEIAQKYRPDAIVTDQSDIAVPTVAYLCESLNLPGIGVKTAEKFTNKYSMRQVCDQVGFPNIDYKLCSSFTEADEFIDKSGLPVIVKPPASQSSRGVSMIQTKGQLSGAFRDAAKHSIGGNVLIESYIPGTEITVDGIACNGGHTCLATSCKEHFSHNRMIAKRLLFTNSHKEIDYQELHAQHNELIYSMKLPFGLTHAEYKYYNGQFYLIEVAARGGGTHLSSHVVPLMSGVDSVGMYVEMALGNQIRTPVVSTKNTVVVMEFLEFEPGIVNKISGIEEIAMLDGIIELGVNIKPGDVIEHSSDDRSRHGHIIAFAENLSELESLVTDVKRRLVVEYE